MNAQFGTPGANKRTGDDPRRPWWILWVILFVVLVPVLVLAVF